MMMLSREKVSRAMEILATLQYSAKSLVEEASRKLAETVLTTREVVKMFRVLIGMLGPRSIVFEPAITVTLPHLVYDNDRLIVERETLELIEITDHSDEQHLAFLLYHQEKGRPLTCYEVTESTTKIWFPEVLVSGNAARVEDIVRRDLEKNGMKLSCELRNFLAFVQFIVENIDTLERGFRQAMARAREAVNMLAGQETRQARTRLEALVEEVRGG